MNTEHLIECSTIGGEGKSHWFDSRDLAGSRLHFPAYNSKGSRKSFRFPKEFEYRPLSVHRNNIIERGTPRLSAGWRERAEAVREQIIKDSKPYR